MGGMSAARANTSGTPTIQPMLPRKRNQQRGRPHNAALDRERNSVGRFSCRLKHFRAVATRTDPALRLSQSTSRPVSGYRKSD
jgi:transposase